MCPSCSFGMLDVCYPWIIRSSILFWKPWCNLDTSLGKLKLFFCFIYKKNWQFQDFPCFSVLNIIVLFAWLRMAEICSSPFDGDSLYDLDMKKAMDIQIFNASLALYNAKNKWVIKYVNYLNHTFRFRPAIISRYAWLESNRPLGIVIKFLACIFAGTGTPDCCKGGEKNDGNNVSLFLLT